MSFTAKERKAMTAAFQRAWRTLLKQQRVTSKNIERIPKLLMAAIVDAAHKGERDELRLAEAAVHRIAVHEHNELERLRRNVSNDKTVH